MVVEIKKCVWVANTQKSALIGNLFKGTCYLDVISALTSFSANYTITLETIIQSIVNKKLFTHIKARLKRSKVTFWRSW